MSEKSQINKKEEILFSAAKVLTNKGYYSSTMDDIVVESKMSKGAVYHYYSSKKDKLDVTEVLEEKKLKIEERKLEIYENVAKQIAHRG